MRRATASPWPLLLAPLLVLPACVTERTTAPTYGVHSPNRSAPRSGAAEPDAATTLPAGPVTRSASPDASVSTRVRASLMDLGRIPYDGQVLPLVSPDGLFVAVETGVAPTWSTLLAAPGAEVPLATSVVAFSLPNPVATPPTPPPGSEPAPVAAPPVAQRLSWAPHTGVVLGRSCDTEGFLIEAPQPDGSRWIGYVRWVSGQLTWLVQGAAVNAYAVLGPDGELAFSRRGVDSIDVQLVVRPSLHDDREVVASAPTTAGAGAGGGGGGGAGGGRGAYLWPVFTDEPGIVYAFSLVAGAIELHSLKIPQKGDPPVLAIVGRQPITRSASASNIYQMTAALQVPLPTRLTRPSGNTQSHDRFDKLIFFHMGQRRMCVFDRRLGSVAPLSTGSLAAVPLLGGGVGDETGSPGSGYLITTPKELEFVGWSQKSEFDRSRGVPATTEGGVSVMKGAYIPRLTNDPLWTAVILGPSPNTTGSEIHLFRLRIE